MANKSIGTIKIKNLLGEIEKFYPNIDNKLISELSNIRNKDTINKLKLLEIYSNIMNGKVKLMYDEPNSTNTKSFIKKTLIAYLEYDANEFVYTVNTSLTSRTTGVPLVAHSFGTDSSKVIIDWGDDTTSELTKTDVLEDPSLLYHTYSDDSKYVVSIKMFGDVYMDTLDSYVEPSEIATYDAYYRGTQYFKNTVTDVLTPLCFTGTVDEYTSTTDMYCVFANCVLLESIPNNIFKNYEPNSYYKTFYNCKSLKLNEGFTLPIKTYSLNANYNSCFEGCSSITTIPNGLIPIESWYVPISYVFVFDSIFKDCTGLTELPSDLFDIYQDENIDLIKSSFISCFEGCTNLKSIPGKIFEDFDSSSFSKAFKNCSKLISVPAGLFDNMNNVTDYSDCFNGCSTLSYVNSFLFYNSEATNFARCFSGCNELRNAKLYFSKPNVITCTDFANSNMTVCVPEDSPKESSFASIVSDTGINVNNNCNLYSFEFTYQSSHYDGIGVPFILDYQNISGINLFIDWGDGYNTTIDNNSYDYIKNDERYTEYKTDDNLIHYCDEKNLGEQYTARIISDSWDKIYWVTVPHQNYNFGGYINHLYSYKWNVISINTPFPRISKLLYYYDSDILNYGIDIAKIEFTDSCICFCCDCVKLTSVCSELFKNNPQITDFSYCFYHCNSLTSIPQDLFKYNTAVTSFSYCFYDCGLLTSIPQDLFKYNTVVTTFSYCFRECSSLTTIPQDLFKYNTAVTDFSYCFYYCNSLTSIPEGLFDNCTAVTTFSGCFYRSSITSIPTDLFKYNTAVTTFYGCFQSCSSLTSIPSGLFDNCINATSFNSCFRDCTLLASIPTGLFNNCTNVTNFSYCFYNCRSLTSIPTGLFDNNTEVTTFSSCFYGCSSLTAIPLTLFYSCDKVTNFYQCFYYCTSLVNFKLILTTRNVTYNNDARYFCSYVSGATRKICVPYDSDTYSSFNYYASTYGYTVSTTEYDCMDSIEYWIDTEATTQGAKLGAIPIVNTSNTEKITVDWGDNNTDELYASDFTLGGYIHEYEQAGEYNIGVYFIHSDIVNLVSVAGDTTNATTEPVRIFRDTYLGA